MYAIHRKIIILPSQGNKIPSNENAFLDGQALVQEMKKQ
jgi:hypothetical protein